MYGSAGLDLTKRSITACEANEGEADWIRRNLPDGEKERYEIPRSFAEGEREICLPLLECAVADEASWDCATMEVSKLTILPLLEAFANQSAGSQCTG